MWGCKPILILMPLLYINIEKSNDPTSKVCSKLRTDNLVQLATKHMRGTVKRKRKKNNGLRNRINLPDWRAGRQTPKHMKRSCTVSHGGRDASNRVCGTSRRWTATTFNGFARRPSGCRGACASSKTEA